MNQQKPPIIATPNEKLDYLAEHIMDRETMHATMCAAVAEGIKAAVSDPALWSAAGAAMQQRAATTAGGWLFGSLGAAFSRLGFLLLFLLAVYMVGGLGAMVAAFKSLVGSATT